MELENIFTEEAVHWLSRRKVSYRGVDKPIRYDFTEDISFILSSEQPHLELTVNGEIYHVFVGWKWGQTEKNRESLIRSMRQALSALRIPGRGA